MRVFALRSITILFFIFIFADVGTGFGADDPWDLAPFSSDPRDLLIAAMVIEMPADDDHRQMS